ncbi:hypothetical protein ACH5RR_012633 [Cinchona calisaya]|uniref:Uncharacterized protein n=1 Tax=Cinchona calisaya TaxID=153742 RepID=A0ABD3AAX7_9GENT
MNRQLRSSEKRSRGRLAIMHMKLSMKISSISSLDSEKGRRLMHCLSAWYDLETGVPPSCRAADGICHVAPRSEDLHLLHTAATDIAVCASSMGKEDPTVVHRVGGSTGPPA